MTLTWGLLGQGHLASERRTRTLGISASIRRFNDLAVPGIGNVWYAKQLLVATFGVRVAERVVKQGGRITNIVAANAIEALACWVTLENRGWRIDPRVRGSTKLNGKRDLAFRVVRQPNFYVTQPMRMGTVTALPMLGLVTANGARFNAFSCSQAGDDLIHAATKDFSPGRKSVAEFLTHWMTTKDDFKVDTGHLRDALSLVTPLPDRARDLMHARLVEGGSTESAIDKSRRGDALRWAESLRLSSSADLSWDDKPAEITSDDHWADMHAGALFTFARDAAMEVLDALEAYIGNLSSGPRFALGAAIPEAVALRLAVVRDAANAFLAASHRDQEANTFCRECVDSDPVRVLQSLVVRDGRVLRLMGRSVVPGPAYRGTTQAAQELAAPDDDSPLQDGEGVPDTRRVNWPEGISFRMRNLFMLNADLNGDLDGWIGQAEPEIVV